MPSWNLYDLCTFLEPFVNLKPENKKDEDESPLLIEKQGPAKSPFDEHELTVLVRERPVLYDKQHEDFRASALRKKAWKEIADISGWDVGSLTRRWRVMRDRFVRELRRTKNNDNDSGHIKCSTFFSDMLFLVRHVKSKKYEAEATDLSSDISRESWDHNNSTGDDSQLQPDRLETCMVADMDSGSPENVQVLEEAADGTNQLVTYEIDEKPQFLECFDAHTEPEQEVYDSDDSDTDQFFTEEVENLVPVEEEQHVAQELIAVQEIPAEQWFQKRRESESVTNAKKRKISFDHKEVSIKHRSISPVASISDHSRYRTQDTSETATDPDIAFGHLIGCMVKKIPDYLKTSIKWKLIQSVDDFEIEHKLK